jgi:ribonuclease BN (tRNA processing enzyme)
MPSDDVMHLQEYNPNEVLRVGEATIRFTETTHFISTFAARYDCGDVSVAYSADTGPDDRVARLAENTKLFICEAAQKNPGRSL